MLNWLFNGNKAKVDPSKDYRRIIPRIAGIIDVTLEPPTAWEILDPFSVMILRSNYGLEWRGATKPHTPAPGEIAFAYLHECTGYADFERAVRLAPQLEMQFSAEVVRRSVDVLATQLGVLLHKRAGAPDANL